QVSYGAEIRPEGRERLDDLIASQRAVLLPVCEAVLADRAASGDVVRQGDSFADPHPPGWLSRALARLWFIASQVRATLRWAKYVALYDGWLDYVVQKVERRSGVALELSPLERRWPLLFLWPKALRYLGRPARRG